MHKSMDFKHTIQQKGLRQGSRGNIGLGLTVREYRISLTLSPELDPFSHEPGLIPLKALTELSALNSNYVLSFRLPDALPSPHV